MNLQENNLEELAMSLNPGGDEGVGGNGGEGGGQGGEGGSKS